MRASLTLIVVPRGERREAPVHRQDGARGRTRPADAPRNVQDDALTPPHTVLQASERRRVEASGPRLLEQHGASDERGPELRAQMRAIEGSKSLSRADATQQRKRRRQEHPSGPADERSEHHANRERELRGERPEPDSRDQRGKREVTGVSASAFQRQEERHPHTVTLARRAASFLGPMPGMRSRSAMDEKPPCCWR